MRTRLKVCCILSAEEARLAIRLGADALGLVAHMPCGPNIIDDDLISRIVRSVPPPISAFLLTSRTEPDDVVSHVLASGADTVQLVDAVPDATHAALRRHAPSVRIVQVLHVADETALDEARRLEHAVDAFLLDSGRPEAAVKVLGGTGRTHDWHISARIVSSIQRPVFLAGGIRPDNVADAIRTVRPFGIDLCTGIRPDGRLNESRLQSLISQIRAADAS
jgi:phosphoribosylanthranilate isomerase